MQRIYQLLERVAPSALPVLILGETGTGKEVLAQRLHQQSVRSQNPLIKINCAGLTESVVESELFGHERGAFTGAVTTHRGVFEAADSGSLFLDEIGELSLRTQAKLLRALELGEFTRVGSTEMRRVDVRFIAATHRDVAQLVARGEFRSDLFYRLNGISIEVPPLRERRTEIVPLAQRFLLQAAQKLKRSEPHLHPSAVALLTRHTWPGNVRELRNVMERAVAVCAGNVICSEVLAVGTSGISALARVQAENPETVAPLHRAPARDIRDQLRAFERACISNALDETGGNQTQAARLLGMTRRTFTNRLNVLGLARRRRTSIPPVHEGREDSEPGS
jgi:transcriptional regulator with GAF, ATPase, and Fis domain